VTLHQFLSGNTYSFINHFNPATTLVPVKKTINGKSVTSSTEFYFTLKQTDGDTVYINKDLSRTLSQDGLQVKITGCGENVFNQLYFTKAGEYTFTLTENDLSADATEKGYTKDANEFTLTYTVAKNDADNSLYIQSATYTSTKGDSGNLLSKDVPTFNNESHLSGTIHLEATKVVENRAQAVQEGEFGFTVSVGGEVIAEKNADGTDKIGTDGKPVKKIFYTQAGGKIDFDIDIDQDDVGTKTYVISEVQGDDDTITYTTDRVRFKVTIAENGHGGVEMTKCEALTDTVFTNTYSAQGTLSLTGTKKMYQQNKGAEVPVRNKEFTFEVYEGDVKVATGTNDATGKITFSDIVYYASDVGTHTYTISEKDEGELFVNYTDQTVTVKVEVADEGDGNLSATIKEVSGEKDDDGNPKFVNEYTLIVPSGIRMDFMPFAVIFALAAGLWILHRSKRRSAKRSRAG
jgi:pilin isopeptide linkage protein